MAENMSSKLQIRHPANNDVFLLNEISPGFHGTIVAMVSRKWDVYKPNGTYLSTDFILSDEQSNLIHCFATRNKSYRFLEKLQEGMLFSFKGFKVCSNRDTFRIFMKAPYILEFDGDTKVAKATGEVGRYLRYPYQIVELEELKPTDQLYVVDLIGYVTNVGEILTKSTDATTLEFNFTNQRGRQVRVTLWGKLGNQMLKKKLANPGVYALILTAMSAKKYIGQLSVSSSSSTQLIDNDEIPALKQFKAALSGRDMSQVTVSNAQTIPHVNTLSELLDWGRMKKADPEGDYSVVFSNSVEVVRIRTSSGWYLITCSSGRCRKGLTREDGVFKCEGCDQTVPYPRFRFKLQLDIKDATATVAVTLFDDPAETLLNRTAKLLMEEELENESEDDVLPPALQKLIGSTHTFEIPGHTYYCSGNYEAFNCTRVILPASDRLLLGAGSCNHPVPKVTVESSSGNAEDSVANHTVPKVTVESSSGNVKDSVAVPTPLKAREPRKRKHVPTSGGKNKSAQDLDGIREHNRLSDVVQTDVDDGNRDQVNTTLLDDVFEEPNRSPSNSKKSRVILESESESDDDPENNLETDDDKA